MTRAGRPVGEFGLAMPGGENFGGENLGSVFTKS